MQSLSDCISEYILICLQLQRHGTQGTLPKHRRQETSIQFNSHFLLHFHFPAIISCSFHSLHFPRHLSDPCDSTHFTQQGRSSSRRPAGSMWVMCELFGVRRGGQVGAAVTLSFSPFFLSQQKQSAKKKKNNIRETDRPGYKMISVGYVVPARD